MKTIRTVTLQEHHYKPGRTCHSIGGPNSRSIEFPPFRFLEIATHPGDSGFYLLHLTESGECADTWHETLELAYHQAELDRKSVV